MKNVLVIIDNMFIYDRKVFEGIKSRLDEEPDKYNVYVEVVISDHISSRKWDYIIADFDKPKIKYFIDNHTSESIVFSTSKITSPPLNSHVITFDNDHMSSLAVAEFSQSNIEIMSFFSVVGEREFKWSKERGRFFRENALRVGATFVDEPLSAIRKHTFPIGVYCATDRSARVLVQHCMDNGINIPEQVSIIGTDCDEMESKIANIAISSIDIQPFQLGKQCAEILLTSHGNGQQNKKLFSELKLVSKSSTLRSNKFNDIVNLAIYYINAYYSAGIKVSDVTEYCGVSRKTLDKKFLSDIGLTVHQYIFDTKLDRAKRLLLKTSNSTDVIALSCGYPSQSYFYQVFKRVVGVTPVEFRNKIQITKSHVG